MSAQTCTFYRQISVHMCAYEHVHRQCLHTQMRQLCLCVCVRVRSLVYVHWEPRRGRGFPPLLRLQHADLSWKFPLWSLLFCHGFLRLSCPAFAIFCKVFIPLAFSYPASPCWLSAPLVFIYSFPPFPLSTQLLLLSSVFCHLLDSITFFRSVSPLCSLFLALLPLCSETLSASATFSFFLASLPLPHGPLPLYDSISSLLANPLTLLSLHSLALQNIYLRLALKPLLTLVLEMESWHFSALSVFPKGSGEKWPTYNVLHVPFRHSDKLAVDMAGRFWVINEQQS